MSLEFKGNIYNRKAVNLNRGREEKREERNKSVTFELLDIHSIVVGSHNSERERCTFEKE